jgi:hypothetical protein
MILNFDYWKKISVFRFFRLFWGFRFPFSAKTEKKYFRFPFSVPLFF